MSLIPNICFHKILLCIFDCLLFTLFGKTQTLSPITLVGSLPFDSRPRHDCMIGSVNVQRMSSLWKAIYIFVGFVVRDVGAD